MDRYFEAMLKIESAQDTKGLFHKLLFTHNTKIVTLIDMLLGKITYLRAIENGTPVGRGLQFRYGLDSQYGEVKLIMKPDFELSCNVGVHPKMTGRQSLIQKRIYATVFADEHGDWEYYDDFDDKFRDEAFKYTFRQYSELPGTTDCWRTSLPPSWCNLQLHLGCNIDFDSILAIIVPGYLKDHCLQIKDRIIFFDDLVEKTRISSLKHKIIYSTYTSPDKYYSFLAPHLKTIPYYQNLFADYPNIKTDVKSAVSGNTYRNPEPYNNSSTMSTALNIFTEEEKIYMRFILLANLEPCQTLLPPMPVFNIRPDETISSKKSSRPTLVNRKPNFITKAVNKAPVNHVIK